MGTWTPARRSSAMAMGLSFSLLCSVLWAWFFVHFFFRESSNRSLAPEHYTVQVVTQDDFRRLSDPTLRDVKLSDGTRILKAPVWDKIVLPNYKPTPDQQHYVLVMTHGTAHCLPYVEHDYVMFALLAATCLGLNVWNYSVQLKTHAVHTDAK